ncbi:hypothetical protein [Streptomyces sp. NPDC007205]|uniref:hypothetical protein n=1 Tax=Streptomyces sp. NPDC007205 TaxID=3154316 RepID=UPI00340EBC91
MSAETVSVIGRDRSASTPVHLIRLTGYPHRLTNAMQPLGRCNPASTWHAIRDCRQMVFLMGLIG